MAEAVKTRIMPAEVVIHPFGDIDEALLNAVQEAVEQRFHIRVVRGGYQILPDSSYSQQRGQYKSTPFLNELSRISASETIRLGIANVDFFVPELSFVFGQANRERKVAVVSVARLDPQFYGEPADSEKMTLRAIKEVIHELGHVFGLEHCQRADCVMWFSNTLAQTDRKGTKFCRSCAERIDC